MSIYQNFSLAGPPRSVPLLVQVRVLFGGFMSQFGWFFFGFGMIFVWVFTFSADLTGWYTFRGELETAPGRITASRDTKVSYNDRRVWEYSYSFAADGQTFEGKARRAGEGDRTNQKVQIEYAKGRPGTSRIQGTSRGMVGVVPGLLPVLFPAVGLCFIGAAAAKGMKGIRLLRDGQAAGGRLIAKEATNTKVNEQVVWRLTFEFTAFDGRKYNAYARTHQPGILEDEAEEPLLYDPADPSCAVMLDDLPGAPRIDQYGQVQCAAHMGALMAFIIPAVSIAGHAAYAFVRYGR